MNGVLTMQIEDDDIKEQNYPSRVWKAKPQVLFHDDGYYIFKFQTKLEKERVLTEGPNYINNIPLEVLSLIPLWVKFPTLHVGYWSVEELSKVDGAMEKISFANILIEVDVLEFFPDMIVIETPSGPWDQPVECDWRPKYCNKCLKFGHNDVECWYNKEDNKEAEVEYTKYGKEKAMINPIVQREILWDNMDQVDLQNNYLWVLCGDFNNVLS
ncbi:hypothetical protein H5410_046704 [Solanum commersonii]|uniref:DUF4283 domain-containing protein n=1 Tax=Solanum commersonii TaxID=4109 RepID=A0A9J5XGH1_SOLCO|nr:hypothetical protein H5410_046704 [Solanum commersonii]